MLEDFTLLVGAITGAFALVEIGRAAIHRWRARRVRRRLQTAITRLLRQERRLGGVILELDLRLQAGTDWVGPSDWPDQLGGELTYASALADEAEREEAMVRSLDADGADERLRQDVEDMHQILAKVARSCVAGALSVYRSREGRPASAVDAGHEVISTFDESDMQELIEARTRFVSLMRTCLHRRGKGGMGSESRAEALDSSWAIERWEADRFDLAALWRGQVRPMRWD